VAHLAKDVRCECATFQEDLNANPAVRFHQTCGTFASLSSALKCATRDANVAHFAKTAYGECATFQCNSKNGLLLLEFSPTTNKSQKNGLLLFLCKGIFLFTFEITTNKKGLKHLKKKITVIVEKTKTGFSAFAPDYPVATTGRTIIELQKHILEVLNFHFEDEGYEVTKSNIALEIDLRQFFQYYKVLNARHLAEKIGMNPTLLSQYVQGRKKPSQQQSDRIIQGIQQIGKELAELKLINT